MFKKITFKIETEKQNEKKKKYQTILSLHIYFFFGWQFINGSRCIGVTRPI